MNNYKEFVSEISSFFNLEKVSGEYFRFKDKNNINNFPKQSIHEYFNDVPLIPADNVIRTDDSTTLFTCAGVQHIETMIKNNEILKDFSIYQPSIRTQFIGKTKEGVSTSFVNFSSTMFDISNNKFLDKTKSYISLLNNYGYNNNDLLVRFEERSNTWGTRKFSTYVASLYYNNFRMGECIFMKDFPIKSNQVSNIMEVGFGLERMKWLSKKDNYYFSRYKEIYDQFKNDDVSIDQITTIIDSVRTSILIAGNGIVPSNNNHGYRLRQLLKHFVFNNANISIPLNKLERIAYDEWKSNTFVQYEEICDIIGKEVERNEHAYLLDLLKRCNIKTNIDITLPNDAFIRSLKSRIYRENTDVILDKLFKEKVK